MRRRFHQHLFEVKFRFPLPEAREELLDSVREILHLLRVGLLHVGRVDDDQRRLADEPLRVSHHTPH